jgi:hypothetical protein
MKEGDTMVKQIKSITSIVLGLFVALLLAFTIGAVTGCGPGTAGYDWHSGEMEIERAPANQ